MSFYETTIAQGNGLKTSNKGGTNATAFLGNVKSLWKYYQTNLDNIRQGKDRALKSVKEVSKDNWQLRFQCGRYAHPLFIDDEGTSYEKASYTTKEQALEQAQIWIDDLRARDRGVLRAIEGAYTKYAQANNIDFDETFFDIDMKEGNTDA